MARNICGHATDIPGDVHWIICGVDYFQDEDMHFCVEGFTLALVDQMGIKGRGRDLEYQDLRFRPGEHFRMHGTLSDVLRALRMKWNQLPFENNIQAAQCRALLMGVPRCAAQEHAAVDDHDL